MKFPSWPPLAVSPAKILAPYVQYDSGFLRSIRRKLGWPEIPLKNTSHLGYHFGDAGLKVTPLAMGIGEMAMMDQLSWFNFGGER